MTSSPFERDSSYEEDAAPGDYEDSWRLDDAGMDEDEDEDDDDLWPEGDESGF